MILSGAQFSFCLHLLTLFVLIGVGSIWSSHFVEIKV